MKKVFKSFLLITISLLCILSFASCKGGIKGEEAKSYIHKFFDAIVAEDYEAAEGLLHPDRPANLEAFFLEIEADEEIDFQSGIEVEKYTSFSSSYYDSSVDGSRYELTMRTKVGDKTVRFTIELVKNEGGYGIYNLNFDA